MGNKVIVGEIFTLGEVTTGIPLTVATEAEAEVASEGEEEDVDVTPCVLPNDLASGATALQITVGSVSDKASVFTAIVIVEKETPSNPLRGLTPPSLSKIRDRSKTR